MDYDDMNDDTIIFDGTQGHQANANYNQSNESDIDLERNVDLIDQYISELWNNVMVQYTTNYNENQILERVSEHAFRNFIIENNHEYRMMLARVKENNKNCG